MRSLRKGLIFAAGALLLVALGGTAAAQTAPRFFPETGQQLQGGFLTFWTAHGGYAVFGPPLSGELGEVDSLGRVYTDQYLANAVLEYHPVLPAGHRVVLAPLGQLAYQTRYPHQLPPMRQNNGPQTPRARYFPDTGMWLGGGFLSYWQTHNGAVILGQPISGELSENDPFTGRPHNVQYFDYGELEWRPELQGTGVSAIQPVALGRLWLARRPPSGPPPTPPRVQGLPTLPPGPPAPPPPTATPTPPPARGVGQVIRFHGIDGQGHLQATVVGYRESGFLNGDAPHGKFVTVLWQVVNVGTTVEAIGSQTAVLQDGVGRRFPPAPPEIQLDARTVYGGHIYFTALSPGQSDAESLTFDVPLDATNFAVQRAP